MKNRTLAAAVLSLGLVVPAEIFAQTTATTPPVGFVNVTVPASSDAILAVPLNRAPEFKGMIQSINLGTSTLTVAGTSPAWAANQFVQSLPGQPKTYAVQLATGTKEGMIAKVTANGANTLTIQLDAGDDLTGVIAEDADGIANNGDQIDLMPYWTPASLFSGATLSQGTQILFFNGAPAGVNLSSTGVFGYDAGTWVDENTFDAADHSPLLFGQGVILRNPAASALNISMVGSVPMSKHRFLIRTLANNVGQDVFLGYSSPVPEPVGNLSLGFAEDDQLLVFNNAAVGQNKSASQVLFYTTGDGWVDDTFTPVGSTFMLQPGQGYIFRKKATPTPTTIVWQDLQGYLQ